MSATRIEFLRAADDVFAGEVYAPPATRSPVIVLLQEIFGVNDSLRSCAKRFVAEGFVVVIPDLFWRIRPGIELGYSPAEVETALAYKARLDVERAVADIGAVLARMRLHPRGDGRVALLGFCMGGTLAFRAAAQHVVDACVVFYGSGIEHLLTAPPRPEVPLLLHFGAADTLIPPASVAAIRDALAARPHTSVVVHADAGHGFFFPERANWCPSAARTAMEQTMQMLRAHLADSEPAALPGYLRELGHGDVRRAEASARILELDASMRRHYSAALRAVARAQSPVILTAFTETGGAFTLLDEGREETVQPVPPRYALLKSVSHTTLAIYSILAGSFTDPSCSERWRAPMSAFRVELGAAHASLCDSDLHAEARARCERVLAAAMDFSDRCLARGTFAVDDYRDYARSVLADVQKNIHEAASLQVESFLPVLDRWRAEVGARRWARLYALVSTVWAMRRDNVHQQILAKVMGEGAIDERLFLAEGVEGRDALLELLGRIILDRGASALVFDDVHVLDRELMGPATACALARMRT